MELRDWLSRVAARNGAAPSSASQYHGFASKIRSEFPRMPLTDAHAHAIGGLLGGAFPTWPDLAAAIRSVLAEAGHPADMTEDERNAARWIAYAQRRIAEQPGCKDHILSLLRSVCWNAYLAMDDGHSRRAADAFDRAFWQARGKRVDHYGPMVARLRDRAARGDAKAQERLAQLQTFSPEARAAE